MWACGLRSGGGGARRVYFLGMTFRTTLNSQHCLCALETGQHRRAAQLTVNFITHTHSLGLQHGLQPGKPHITLMTLTKSKRSRFRFTTLGVVRLMHMRARACVRGGGRREGT